MKHVITLPEERGTKKLEWLLSRFSLSFSSYQDPTKQGFGQLKAFNDDLLQPGLGFGTHPHDNMEIISIMLKGIMSHKDSMGYEGNVGPYDVQIMSAGSGLFHSEYNVSENNEVVNFLQIWINPKIKNTQPSYKKMSFPLEGRKNSLKKIIANEKSTEFLYINQEASLYLGNFEAGKNLDYNFKKDNRCVFIFILDGEAVVNDVKLEKRYSIGIWDTEKIEIKFNKETEFVLIEVPVNQ